VEVEMSDISFRDGLREVLRSELTREPRMVVVGENIATWGGAAGVTQGLVEEFGPRRIIETPVVENVIVGLALGGALAGLTVVTEVYSADFLLCAGSEVMNDIAKWRFQHHWDAPINLVLRMPMCSSGIAAGPEHTQAIEGLLHHVPGLVVVVPGDVREAIGSLRAALGCGDPVIFLEHRRLYDMRQAVSVSDLTGYKRNLKFGSIVTQGADLTVVAWGWMRQLVERVVRAAELERGPSIEVIDPVTIKPMDIDLITESVTTTKRLLVVEEAPITGSVSAEIVARVVEGRISGLRGVERLTMPDLPNPFDPELEASLVPDEGRIRLAMDRVLAC
jgi:pyruvate/2-oxoglutarate/acetoin dehydrogenase E1 component